MAEKTRETLPGVAAASVWELSESDPFWFIDSPTLASAGEGTALMAEVS